MDISQTAGWWSLLPPVLAIGLALLTRQVFLSLGLGIASGYLILAGGNPITATFDTIDAAVAVFSDAGNTRVIIFTLVIGALIALIQRSGGVAGFIERLLAWLDRRVKSAESKDQRVLVELFALGMGLLLFIESNISILTVGTLFRPVTDKLGMPREKLALIADTGSAPSCVLIPFNAWGAYLMGLIAAEGLSQPFSQLIQAALFNFYPMLIIVILLVVILTRRDIGEMKTAEARGTLLREGAVPMISDEASDIPPAPGATPRALNMIMPILTMVVLVPIFLIMTGEGDSWFARMQDGSGSSAILYSTSIAVALAIILYKAQGVLGVRESADTAIKGMGGMLPLAILMLLAFALGSLCRTLGTGVFTAEVTSAFLSPALMPALVFLISCFVAFSTGTSWGTFAIMIPIAVPLAASYGIDPSLAIAAAIGGGVFGDHCSPTSDTSIIASMASGSDHIDHIRTQLPYALLAGGVTVAAYLVLGFTYA
ncbi:sodium:proton antiporter [Algimonas ampicilliniresistens]|uniref:Sodium:proton antiporter n=1 Tax=Algimonas ampicilliniresistens TaxID=1298735 RepID=A0ABQ5VAA4_9PROT|nr:Na+/H+ antiporter NhaC family protein [Algimonas ampicilliniresistens]GLQ23997.1 sodium:proton antiporter [Algimonas ampicilliniresistens]